MNKLFLLILLAQMPLYCMKRSHGQEIVTQPHLKKRKFFDAQLEQKEFKIKERIFNDFMERYHHNEYLDPKQMPPIQRQNLQAAFFNNTLDPNRLTDSLLIKEYNEIMSEWFSNFE